jgi:nitrous oxide reductase accessory protein NosL
MKLALLAALLLSPAVGQTTTAPTPEPPSIHEQIKADRAKAKLDEENGPKARHWDRGADGKRPWDSSKEIPPTKE